MDSIRSCNSCTFFFFVNLCKCRLHYYCRSVCLFLALVAPCLLPPLYVWVLILLSSLTLLSHTYSLISPPPTTLSLSLHPQSTKLKQLESTCTQAIGKLLQETICLYYLPAEDLDDNNRNSVWSKKRSV